MRYSLLAVLIVIAVLQLFSKVQVAEPPDLPPLPQTAAALAADDETPPPSALSHEIRTMLRTAPSHTAATQPASADKRGG
jgi:hypothetical protein